MKRLLISALFLLVMFFIAFASLVSAEELESPNSLKATDGNASVPIPVWPAGSRLELTENFGGAYTLTWTPAENAQYYVIYRNGRNLGRSPSTRPYFADRLDENTLYTYRVEAYNEGGTETDNGPQLTVRTEFRDHEGPVISSLQPAKNAVVNTPNPVISFVATDKGRGLERIAVTLDSSELLFSKSYEGEKVTTVTTPAHGLSNGNHDLDIQAWDKIGNQTNLKTSFTVAAAPSGPVWPEGSMLTASNVTSSSLTLNWTLAQGATGYRIYRDGSVAGSVYGSVYSYDVLGLQPDTTYTFSVEAVDAAGHVSENNPATTVKTKASQGPAEAVRLQVRPGFLNVGSVLELQVRADRAEDVYAFLAKLQYDPAKFKLLQASLHPEFGTEGTTAVRGYNAPAPDRVHVSGSLLGQTTGRSGDVGLAALRFSVLQQGSGKFTLQPDSQLASSQGATRTLPGPVTLTVNAGSADFDQDGRIGLSDLILISQRSGARVGQPGYDSLYDLNNDGVIDSTDVQYVADKVAG
ncbi:hypothetical protein Elgi_39370 [Paenibacillus elgii]|uniref:fibronectin type III domain-containing protein n=1 Tax=Paenibacillus elgii TaxID=189691 RepID=UPI002D7AB2B1|nr:hypothetical protein Elgi_39370 [Paenibacillus elgii]